MKAEHRWKLPLIVLLGLLAMAFPARRLAVAQVPLSAIIEPDDGREPIINLIASAQASIDVAMYQLSDRQIVTALEDAAHRGVQVRVLAEPLPGGKATNRSSLASLQRTGVQTHDSSSRFRLTHQKTIVVDTAVALIMTLNLTAGSFSSSREVTIPDNDPSDVAEIEAVFQADWDRQPFSPSQPNLVWSPDNARGRLLGLISSAQAELDVYAEELTDANVVATLATVAGQGVQVRLMMTDVGEHDPARAARALLASSGVEVRLLRSPYVHAKVILVDRALAFAGSENLTAASLDKNRELGL
ncbi:MAG: phospholipase D-like domain-containing protein, partial [Dehalococcoidia bacterium]